MFGENLYPQFASWLQGICRQRIELRSGQKRLAMDDVHSVNRRGHEPTVLQELASDHRAYAFAERTGVA
jgi:hypothetical protein